MRKICLTVIGIHLLLLHAFSQVSKKDSSGFKQKRLHLDEINLVSSYYTQSGDHSSIQGGIGSEKVTDLANGLELQFVGWDGHSRKNTLTVGLGLDHHTAASQAYISKTGASKTGGTRIYPSVNWLIENEKKGAGFGLGAYYSNEYNYKSIALDAQFIKKTNNNGEFNAKVTGYFDQVKLIYPSELIPEATTNTSDSVIYVTTASGQREAIYPGGATSTKSSTPSSPRNTYTAALSWSQVINTRMQASIGLDGVAQNGYLGLPFHRVYFTDGKDTVEKLPSQRLKLPIGLRLNYFLGDNIILKTYYRYYIDNWGIRSHTASLEVPVKITPFFSISPFYRYYVQTSANYFAPYEQHSASDTYYTSNYALSAFSSNFFGTGIRLAPPKGIFGTHLNTLDIRYGHYAQTTDLVSDVISLNLKFK